MALLARAFRDQRTRTLLLRLDMFAPRALSSGGWSATETRCGVLQTAQSQTQPPPNSMRVTRWFARNGSTWHDKLGERTARASSPANPGSGHQGGHTGGHRQASIAGSSARRKAHFAAQVDAGLYGHEDGSGVADGSAGVHARSLGGSAAYRALQQVYDVWVTHANALEEQRRQREQRRQLTEEQKRQLESAGVWSDYTLAEDQQLADSIAEAHTRTREYATLLMSMQEHAVHGTWQVDTAPSAPAQPATDESAALDAAAVLEGEVAAPLDTAVARYDHQQQQQERGAAAAGSAEQGERTQQPQVRR